MELAYQPESNGWVPQNTRRGRGATINMAGRFESQTREPLDDGWGSLDDLEPIRTTVTEEHAKTIISYNQSPDLPFDRSINPYRGCEHGCSYCYARPSHAHMGLSPGLDFESHLFVKPNAPALLEDELAKSGYVAKPIILGANTDPYQPIEKKWLVTRSILSVLARRRHPVIIITKSALVLRDMDILEPMARIGLAKVFLSITSLDHKLSRSMEPRASTPARRLEALAKLNEAGVSANIFYAPVIPAINDHEMEAIFEAAKEAGAEEAYYVLLRLPLEVAPLFKAWLAENYPDRAARVMSLVRSTRGGRENDPAFGSRMKGIGPYAEMIGRRFKLAIRRLQLNERSFELRTDLFRPPMKIDAQMRLL